MPIATGGGRGWNLIEAMRIILCSEEQTRRDIAVLDRLHPDLGYLAVLLYPDCPDFLLLDTDVLSDEMEFWRIAMRIKNFDSTDREIMLMDVLTRVDRTVNAPGYKHPREVKP